MGIAKSFSGWAALTHYWTNIISSMRFSEARFDDLRDGRRLKFAHTYYKALGAKSLLAFDLVRAINLSRWGYLVGYVSGRSLASHHVFG